MKFKKLIRFFSTDINHYTNIDNIKSIHKNGLLPSDSGYLSAIPSKYDELSKSNWVKTQKDFKGMYETGELDPNIPVSILDTYPLKYRQLNIMDGRGMSAGLDLDPVIRVKTKTHNDTDIDRKVKAYRENYDIDPRVEIRVPKDNIDQSNLKFQVPKGMTDSALLDRVYYPVEYKNAFKSEPIKHTSINKSDYYINKLNENKDLFDKDDKDTKNALKMSDIISNKNVLKSRGRIRDLDDIDTSKHTYKDIKTPAIRKELAKSLNNIRGIYKGDALDSRVDDHYRNALNAQLQYNSLPKSVKYKSIKK